MSGPVNPTIRKELGWIESVNFGYGGYQEAMIGFSFTLCGEGWGVGDFKGHWNTNITTSSKWAEQDRITKLGNDCMFVRELLETARVKKLSALKGVPIEVEFESNTLKSWRILREVIKQG